MHRRPFALLPAFLLIVWTTLPQPARAEEETAGPATIGAYALAFGMKLDVASVGATTVSALCRRETGAIVAVLPVTPIAPGSTLSLPIAPSGLSFGGSVSCEVVGRGDTGAIESTLHVLFGSGDAWESVEGGPREPSPGPVWLPLDDPSQRFVLLPGDAMVLDRETQLVWQREPGTPPSPFALARSRCTQLDIQGHMGWRLPKLSELVSLLVETAPSTYGLAPFQPFVLPPGQNVTYWTSTPRITLLQPGPGDAILFRAVTIGPATNPTQTLATTDLAEAWCVRAAGGP